MNQVEICGKDYSLTPDYKLVKRRGKGTVKAFPDKDGYLKYAFTTYKGTYNIAVHRFVWELVNGPVPDGMTVDHIDGDKTNNHISNLQLLSAKDNVIKGNAKHWLCVDPSGITHEVYNLTKFCRENFLHQGHMSAIAHKQPTTVTHKGWNCYVKF